MSDVTMTSPTRVVEQDQVLGRRETAEPFIRAEIDTFVAANGRPPTTIVFNNISIREICKWHGPLDAWNVEAGQAPELMGLKVYASTRVTRVPGFLLL